ncbi:MAG: arylesterase [Rhodospirillales bacterium]|nr:arylesterase [Rhodospirillales bacterium]
MWAQLAWIMILLVIVSGSHGAPPPPVKLLVIGDSLTAGYGLSRENGFPAQLQRALSARGLAVRVIDGGVSGDTTSGGRARLRWMLGGSPSPGPDAAPDAVIVQLGANDALRGIDPNITYANLAAMLTELKGRDLPVLLAGMRAPPNLGEDYRKSFDAIYPRLAEVYGVALYPFFLDGVAAVPALNQADGIHPNAEGVAEIVRRITPAAAALVATAAQRMQERAAP